MNILFLLTPQSQVASIYSDCTLRQGLEKMKAHGYTALPVLTRDNQYVGTVSEGDFLWNMLDRRDNSIKSKEKLMVSDILRPGFNPSVNIYVTMEELMTRAVSQSFIPVVDDRGFFIGIVTRQKIIQHFIDKQSHGQD